MRHIQRAICLLISILLLVPPAAPAQGTSSGDWAALQRLVRGDKLSIELKSGKTIPGEFRSATDTMLTIWFGDRGKDIDRNDVKRVYRLFGRSIGKTTLQGTAIGAMAGAAVGAAIGEDCGRPSFGPCFGRGPLAVLGAAVFAIPGAIGGLIVAVASRHRQVIYEA